MAYQRKTIDRWDIETNYGYGWEVENSEYTREDATFSPGIQRELAGIWQMRRSHDKAQRKIGGNGMTLRTTFGVYEGVYLQVGEYPADGSVAIQAWNREDGPIATHTVCLCDRSLGEGEAYIDTNNCPWAVDFIEQEGLGKRTGRTGWSGYCIYPVVKFDMEKVKEKEDVA